MPIYEYQCEDCAHEIEVLQKISDPRLTDLTLAQLKIADGWIALAMAPPHPGGQAVSSQQSVREGRRGLTSR